MAEQTKDQLQALVNQLTTDLATSKGEALNLSQERNSFRDGLASAKQSVTDLQAQLTDERTRSGDLAGELNEAQNLIEELQKRLILAATLQEQSDTVIVTDGTSHYKVLAPRFKYKHVEYTADSLRNDQELVQQLVAAGVGVLQKIETEE